MTRRRKQRWALWGAHLAMLVILGGVLVQGPGEADSSILEPGRHLVDDPTPMENDPSEPGIDD